MQAIGRGRSSSLDRPGLLLAWARVACGMACFIALSTPIDSVSESKQTPSTKAFARPSHAGVDPGSARLVGGNLWGSERCEALMNESLARCGPHAVLKGGEWCTCHQGARAWDRPLKTCKPFSSGHFLNDSSTIEMVGGTFLAELRRDCECVLNTVHRPLFTADGPRDYGSIHTSPLPPLKGSEVVDGSEGTGGPSHAWMRTPEEGPTITLLVSHFAMRDAREKHYGEIEGAMRANLQNAALTELYVLYEKTYNDSCADLRARLLKHNSTQSFGGHPALLTCLDCPSGQPTVADLLAFASKHARGGTDPTTAPRFAGRVVVLSNPDVVFDKSLAAPPTLLPDLTVTDLLVLSVTQGPVAKLYEATVDPWPGMRSARAPHATPTWCPGIRQDVSWTLSWDAFMFVPPLPPLNKTTDGHYMNELEAEHRTVWALRAAGITVRNACLLAKVQHFHLTPKMHHAHTARPNERVLPKVGYHDACGRGFPVELRMFPCTFYRPDWDQQGVYVVSTEACKFCPEESKCYP
jgi:hypothetical protein